MKISGNTILITGGASGIGEALAEALHQKGNRVIIAGRRADALAATANRNPGMEWMVLDVSDAAAVKTFARDVTTKFPALNVLINNAGIMKPESLRTQPDLTDMEAMIGTNLIAPLRLTAALLPSLLQQKDAVVMNVTSGLAFVPLAMTPTYSATKAALHSYTQSLRQQLKGTSVQVIELAPPAVQTDLMPGQATAAHAMPLADYTTEVMMLLEKEPHADEVLVERVKFLRFAETNGKHAQVFGMLNGPR
jgi:uncharacterized oxidoreductase